MRVLDGFFLMRVVLIASPIKESREPVSKT